MTTRSDLEWALRSVIPHGGRTAETAVVGIEPYAGSLWVYATDRYTTGIARIHSTSHFDVRLPLKEATDLMRFIRPNRVAEQAEELTTGFLPGEFHVALDDGESAVFDTTSVIEHPLRLSDLLDFVGRLYDAPVEWDECIYQPALMQKFSKASRHDSDRMRIFPRHAREKWGAGVITVGSDFVGAIAGMTYDSEGLGTIESFLQRERAAA